MPNTILLGLIPAGKNKKNIPLQSISNAQESNWYKVGLMLIGFILAFAGFFSMSQSAFGGLILAAFGVFLFLNGFKSRITVERNSGVEEYFDVPFFEAEKVRKIVEDINNSVASYEDSQDYRHYGTKNTQTLVNAFQNAVQPQQQYNQQQTQNTAAQVQAQPTVNQANDVQNSDVPNASAVQENQFCPKCGSQNAADASFCTNCGAKLPN